MEKETMPKKKQRTCTTRFKRLRQLAEQNATSGLSEVEALALAEQAREEVYQIKRQKSADS
jgi:hypothetical protein